MMTYKNKACRQFVKDMKKAGLKPYHYNGRYFWEGPAVNVETINDARSKTKVRCQSDEMGLGYVVYPVASDAGNGEDE